MKLNLNKGNNKMRYEQKAELQDSNKARMYEEKKKKYSVEVMKTLLKLDSDNKELIKKQKRDK